MGNRPPSRDLERRVVRLGGYPAGSNDPIRTRPKQARELFGTKMRIRANVGVRMPLNNRGDRSTSIGFYLLWDWFDGGLREGWK